MAGEPDDVDTMVEPVVPSRHGWLAGLLAALPGDRVVDLGCGTGSTLAQVDAGLALGLDVSSAARPHRLRHPGLHLR
jgi:predicted RNA methylase